MVSPTDGHEFEQALGVGDGQGSLACCDPWVAKSQKQLSVWTELGTMVCILNHHLTLPHNNEIMFHWQCWCQGDMPFHEKVLEYGGQLKKKKQVVKQVEQCDPVFTEK